MSIGTLRPGGRGAGLGLLLFPLYVLADTSVPNVAFSRLPLTLESMGLIPGHRRSSVFELN